MFSESLPVFEIFIHFSNLRDDDVVQLLHFSIVTKGYILGEMFLTITIDFEKDIIYNDYSTVSTSR